MSKKDFLERKFIVNWRYPGIIINTKKIMIALGVRVLGIYRDDYGFLGYRRAHLTDGVHFSPGYYLGPIFFSYSFYRQG
jgi:hypothetical protein